MIYQISRDQETSSSCSQCKRQHQQFDSQTHPQHDNSSSQQQQDIKLPLTKPRSTNPHHEQNTTLITLLHQQIKQLRINNDSKDKMIMELKRQLKSSKSNLVNQQYYNPQHKQYPYSAKQIQGIRNQGRLSSPKGNMSRLFSPQLKPRLHQQYRLQTVVLQKQIKDLQMKVMQLNAKLKDYQQNCDWMQKFALSFTNMAQDLSLKYGGNVNIRGLSLRKKTKICWKYMKQLINYLIQ